MYLKDHNISFIYKPQPIPYIDNGTKRLYYPDFFVENTYIETKGECFIDDEGFLINPYTGNRYIAKTDFMRNNNVLLFLKKDLANAINYVEITYGKTFIKECREIK